jgi:hypothetical protein
MEKKIKKLNIKVEKGGMMCPQPGEFMKQSITIKNNGQIWFNTWRNLTEEEMSKGFIASNGVFAPAVVVREQKNIGSANAQHILERASEVLPKYIDKEYELHICDACPDEVIIEYEDGEIVVGQLVILTYELDEVGKFYDFLVEETLIENLFFFDERILGEAHDED